MTRGRASSSARRAEEVGHLGPGHRLVPGGQHGIVVVGQVVEHLGAGEDAGGPHVGDVQDQGPPAPGLLGDVLGDGPLLGVGQEVEAGGGAQDPEAVDAGVELGLDQPVEWPLRSIERSSRRGVARGGTMPCSRGRSIGSSRARRGGEGKGRGGDGRSGRIIVTRPIGDPAAHGRRIRSCRGRSRPILLRRRESRASLDDGEGSGRWERPYPRASPSGRASQDRPGGSPAPRRSQIRAIPTRRGRRRFARKGGDRYDACPPAACLPPARGRE